MWAAKYLEGHGHDQGIINASMKYDLSAVLTLPGRTTQHNLVMPRQHPDIPGLLKMLRYESRITG
jgi:hypothetical protein